MKKKTEEKGPAAPVVKKSIRHLFTPDEVAEMNVNFRRAYVRLAAIEAEQDSVKSKFKAQLAEQESIMASLDAALQLGWESRHKDCYVVFRPADSKKDYYPVSDGVGELDLAGRIAAGEKPADTEDMTAEDFEQDLLMAEREFERRSEVLLWDAAGDAGKIVVASLRGKWFSAVRANIGGQRLDERLDGEQKCFKHREDAVGAAGRRAMDWLESTLGRETAQGFAAGIVAALEAERGKVE